MEESKTYLNKDIAGLKIDSLENDFITSDFIDQLEWAMLITQQKFKQIRIGDHLKDITRDHFDKALLMNSTMNPDQKFFAPFTDLQAGPEIFPNINIKILNIGETIVLQKLKELTIQEKRHLTPIKPHIFDYSYAFYKKDTESFYGAREGWQVGKQFFNETEMTLQRVPAPISLVPGYSVPDIKTFLLHHADTEVLAQLIKTIGVAYQLAMSMYYEWSIYIKEYDNIGFVIPIEPSILSEIYKGSMLNFENKKAMLHFVRDHYRRKAALSGAEYEVYVRRYLRGEHKFSYRNFYTEIIPPKYDLNRATTKKKFVDFYK